MYSLIVKCKSWLGLPIDGMLMYCVCWWTRGQLFIGRGVLMRDLCCRMGVTGVCAWVVKGG